MKGISQDVAVPGYPLPLVVATRHSVISKKSITVLETGWALASCVVDWGHLSCIGHDDKL